MPLRWVAMLVVVGLAAACGTGPDAADRSLCTQWDRARDVSYRGEQNSRGEHARVRAMLPRTYWNDATRAWYLDGWEALRDAAGNDSMDAWEQSSDRLNSRHRHTCGRPLDPRTLLAIPILSAIVILGIRLRRVDKGPWPDEPDPGCGSMEARICG